MLLGFVFLVLLLERLTRARARFYNTSHRKQLRHVYPLRGVWAPLASAFRPEVAWGIFGNTDAWAIAQGIAREAGCPWVRDIKDQWTAFIPAPLQRLVAARYADWLTYVD